MWEAVPQMWMLSRTSREKAGAEPLSLSLTGITLLPLRVAFLVLTVRITGDRGQNQPCLGVCWN